MKRSIHIAALIALLAPACGSNSAPPSTPSSTAPALGAPAPTVNISSVELSPSTTIGGQSIQVTVTFAGPAPAGTVVGLSTTSQAVSPASTTAQEGATKVTMTVTTRTVTAPFDVTLRVQTPSDSRDTVLHLLPIPDLSSIELNAVTLNAGETTQGTVRLAKTSTVNVDVALSASNTAVVIPSAVTIPAGATFASFTIAAQVVQTDTAVSITATLGNQALPISLTVLAQLPTFFSYTSDPGDFIGLGQSARRAPPSYALAADALCGKNWVVVTSGPFTDQWDIEFSAPRGQQLVPGTYNAIGDIRNLQNRAGLTVSGNAHSCSSRSTGTFTVTDAQFSASGNVIRFHATFEYHCEAASAAIRGEVSMQSPPRVNRFAGCL
jgi:hypothetical protein